MSTEKGGPAGAVTIPDGLIKAVREAMHAAPHGGLCAEYAIAAVREWDRANAHALEEMPDGGARWRKS